MTAVIHGGNYRDPVPGESQRAGAEAYAAWNAARASYGENPWGRVPDAATTLEDLGVSVEDYALWDEVEDWDDRVPLRHSVRTSPLEFTEEGGLSLEAYERFLLGVGHEPEPPPPPKATPAPTRPPRVTRARARKADRPARTVPLPPLEPVDWSREADGGLVAVAPDGHVAHWTDDNGNDIAGAPTTNHTPRGDRRPPRRQPKKLSRKAKKRAKKALASASRAIAPPPIPEPVEEPVRETYEQALKRVWGEG